MRIPLFLKDHPALGLFALGGTPETCFEKPCGQDCLEHVRGFDEWDSIAHAANQALEKYAVATLKSIRDGAQLPVQSLDELYRLQYEAHFFTMPRDANLKALWNQWASDMDFLVNPNARLRLEECANQCMVAAKSLDSSIRTRIPGRQHTRGCRCMTRTGNSRFELYYLKSTQKLRVFLTEQGKILNPMSRDDMIEMSRLRYDNTRLAQVPAASSVARMFWIEHHSAHQILPSHDDPEKNRAIVRAASDTFRAEMKWMRPLLMPAAMIVPGLKKPHFKCPYMSQDWIAVHAPQAGADEKYPDPE